jgi:dihydroneopterin aldolase
MTDSIILEDLAFYGYHGVKPEEKRLGQRFVVDLALSLDLAPAGRADDLSLTVNYAEAYRVVRELVEGPARDTLESLAEAIAAALLERFEPLEAVMVRVRKPSPPIAGALLGSAGVEINRNRSL